ncbi:uncharacterized protein LOC144169479 [Haemaphysalis longicornis]
MKLCTLLVAICVSGCAYVAALPTLHEEKPSASNSELSASVNVNTDRLQESLGKLLQGDTSLYAASEVLKALDAIKSDLEPGSEEYIWGEIFRRIALLFVKQAASKGTSYVVGKLIKKG